MSINLFDSEIALNIAFSDFGGIWRPSEMDLGFHVPILRYVESVPRVLIDVAQDMLAQAEDVEDVRIPEIQFGLINSQTLNCFASVMSGRYYVGISVAMPIALLELAAYLFNRKTFFSQVGNSEGIPPIALDGVEEIPLFQIAENRFQPRFAKDLSEDRVEALAHSISLVRGSAFHMDETGRRLDGRTYINQFQGLLELLMPRCLIRRHYVQQAARIMTYFFWLHEIAHVTQGHLRTLRELSPHKRSSLFEFPDSRLPAYMAEPATISDISLFSFELDADCEAIVNTIGMILIDLDIEDEDRTDLDAYGRITLFTVMLVAVFGSMGKRSGRRSWSQSLSHPPERIRLANILNYLLNFAHGDQKLRDAVQEGVKIANELGQFSDFGSLNAIALVTDDEIAEMSRINNGRLKIPSAWDQYRYGNLRVLARSFIRGGLRANPSSLSLR